MAIRKLEVTPEDDSTVAPSLGLMNFERSPSLQFPDSAAEVAANLALSEPSPLYLGVPVLLPPHSPPPHSPSYHPHSPTPDPSDYLGDVSNLTDLPTPPLEMTATFAVRTSNDTEVVDHTAPLEFAHPGPPWFRWADFPGLPPFQVKIAGQLINLPYLRYKETSHDLVQLGTEGRDRPTYSRVPYVGFSSREPTELDRDVFCLAEDATFNFALSQALDCIDDPGVLAEVTRYRRLSAQLPTIAASAEAFEEAKRAFMKTYDRQQTANRGFLAQLEASRQRLTYGRVRTRVQEAMEDLVKARAAGGRYYWMGLPGRPEHPNRHYLPGTERRWAVAQEREESSGNSGEQEEEIPEPLIRKKRLALEAIEARKKGHKCRWCKVRGHFNKACPVPHLNCSGRCEVPQDHAYFFPKFCELPNKRRGRPRKAKNIVNADVPSCSYWD